MFHQYQNVFFTTATILNWNHLLKDDLLKDIIIESFRFCTVTKRAKIWAFVIMENHIHLVWYIEDPNELRVVLSNMLKFTAQRIIHKLIEHNNEELLLPFLVRKKDRHFQIWKRKSLSIEILSENVLWQKINYIHQNRTRKGFNDLEYKYSSARYFATGIKDWDFLV